jgi:DNA-binding NarL/FixJ family response regulator
MAVLLLVEDNAILATTLVRFLRSQQNLDIAAVVPSAEAALETLRTTEVDLLLVDVALPGMNGIDLVAAVQEQHPGLKCLILSGHVEAGYVGRALAAGAKGYVVKGDPTAILEGIHSVVAGKNYLSRELQGKLVK